MYIGLWQPIFTGYDGRENVQVEEFYYAIGVPDCGPMQMWPVYHYQTVNIKKIKNARKKIF